MAPGVKNQWADTMAERWCANQQEELELGYHGDMGISWGTQ